MILLKTDRKMLDGVVNNCMHASAKPPEGFRNQLKKGDIILITLKKGNLRPFEKPIQYAMVFDYYQEDHQGESFNIWGKRWKYLIVGSEIRVLTTPFDLDEVRVTNKVYKNAQWKGNVHPEDESEINRLGLLGGASIFPDQAAPEDAPENLSGSLEEIKYGPSGESDEHRLLKEYITIHPTVIGLDKKSPPGSMEFSLPSRDTIDILFEDEDEWVAVEVKSAHSGTEDLRRGLYQCVKYRALMRAMQRVSGSNRGGKAVLALGGHLPGELRSISRILNIPVVEGINIV